MDSCTMCGCWQTGFDLLLLQMEAGGFDICFKQFRVRCSGETGCQGVICGVMGWVVLLLNHQDEELFKSIHTDLKDTLYC
jgi:hypothetical protein